MSTIRKVIYASGQQDIDLPIHANAVKYLQPHIVFSIPVKRLVATMHALWAFMLRLER